MSPTAGWYADPGVPGRLRWWDGSGWTEHVTADPTATGSAEDAGDDDGTHERTSARARSDAGAVAAGGWYADPSGSPGQLRWWDGRRWTDQTTADPGAVPGPEPESMSEPKSEPTTEPGAAPELRPVPHAESERTLRPEPSTAAGTALPAAHEAAPRVDADVALVVDTDAVETRQETPSGEASEATVARQGDGSEGGVGAVDAGWYPDPSGVPDQVRWWDGDDWTDHVTADVGAADPDVTEPTDVDDEPGGSEIPPAPVAPIDDAEEDDALAELSWLLEDRPAASSETSVAAEEPAAAGSTASDGDADGGAPSVDDTAETAPIGDATEEPSAEATATDAPAALDPGAGVTAGTPRWERPSRRGTDGPHRRRTALVAVVLLLLVLVGVAVAGLLSERGDDPPGATASDTTTEAEPPSTIGPGGELRPGAVVEGNVPPDGANFEATLVVEAPQEVTLDVRSDGFDAVLELVDEVGERIAYNDDRAQADVDRVGGAPNDPYIAVDLDLGTYRVVVRGFDGASGDFVLRTS